MEMWGYQEEGTSSFEGGCGERRGGYFVHRKEDGGWHCMAEKTLKGAVDRGAGRL